MFLCTYQGRSQGGYEQVDMYASPELRKLKKSKCKILTKTRSFSPPEMLYPQKKILATPLVHMFMTLCIQYIYMCLHVHILGMCLFLSNNCGFTIIWEWL